MIKNLIFDFGKVLVDYDFDHTLDTFFDDPAELEKFKAMVTNPAFVDRCDKEEIPFADFVENLRQQYPQWDRQWKMFYDQYQDFVTGEVPGMRELLTRLRGEGFRLYGLTNWCSAVQKVIETYPVLQMLDGRVISSEEHLLKPEAPIYRCLLERFDLKAEECIFTDDKPANIAGARAVGLNAILFHDAEQYESELRKMLQHA